MFNFSLGVYSISPLCTSSSVPYRPFGLDCIFLLQTTGVVCARDSRTQLLQCGELVGPFLFFCPSFLGPALPGAITQRIDPNSHFIVRPSHQTRSCIVLDFADRRETSCATLWTNLSERLSTAKYLVQSIIFFARYRTISMNL